MTEIYLDTFKKISSDTIFLNLGPQHPSTHGVLRVKLRLDGEVIVGCEPVVGYLHRGVEKLSENRTYQQLVVLSDRNDYLSSMINNWVYCLAVEKLLGIEIPPRAEFIRIIVGELQRIASHLVFFGTFCIDLGAFTPFLYAFGREREMILDLFEKLCGARLTYNYIRIGGVAEDIPGDWISELKKFTKWMQSRIPEYNDLITYNPIFIERTKNIGIIHQTEAISWGITGPMLRASGVKFDLRKNAPYGYYQNFNFDIPIGINGDCWDRLFVRIREIEEALKIINQAVEGIPEGPVMGKVPKLLRVPAGEAYSEVESPRGILGIYLVSDGSEIPYRLHIRAPSFINLSILQEILIGWKVADVIAILGSIDIVLGEVDR